MAAQLDKAEVEAVERAADQVCDAARRLYDLAREEDFFGARDRWRRYDTVLTQTAAACADIMATIRERFAQDLSVSAWNCLKGPLELMLVGGLT